MENNLIVKYFEPSSDILFFREFANEFELVAWIVCNPQNTVYSVRYKDENLQAETIASRSKRSF